MRIRRTSRKPDTFLIGAPKSGTTSLYGYLREHPDVFMSREKEPEYFAPDVVHMRRGRPFIYPTDEARYLSLFARARHEARAGEASTSYLASHDAPRLIRAFQPAALIIVMLRNPVDLIHSLYGHRIAHGSEWITDFATALEADADRRRGKRLQLGRPGLGAAYRDYAMLGDQLERWLDEFGAERIHTISFNDFVTDTEDEFAKVLKFLEVDESFRPASFAVHNQSHRRRSGPIRLAFSNPLVRWLSRSALPAMIGERATARLARRINRRRFTRRPVNVEPVSPEVRRELEREFERDVEKLGRLLGRDVKSEWFGSTVSGAAA